MSCYILDKCTCNCLKLSGENPSYFLSSRGRKNRRRSGERPQRVLGILYHFLY
jgi:hypothetical protein